MNFDDRRVRLAMLVLAILAVIAAPTWLLFYQYFTADLFRELPDFLREVPAAHDQLPSRALEVL